MYLTKSELKAYKELFEIMTERPVPTNFSGAQHKIDVKGTEIRGHIDSNGICQRIEIRTKDGVIFQSTK